MGDLPYPGSFTAIGMGWWGTQATVRLPLLKVVVEAISHSYSVTAYSGGSFMPTKIVINVSYTMCNV
jgi:hypothetical protein